LLCIQMLSVSILPRYLFKIWYHLQLKFRSKNFLPHKQFQKYRDHYFFYYRNWICTIHYQIPNWGNNYTCYKFASWATGNIEWKMNMLSPAWNALATRKCKLTTSCIHDDWLLLSRIANVHIGIVVA